MKAANVINANKTHFLSLYFFPENNTLCLKKLQPLKVVILRLLKLSSVIKTGNLIIGLLLHKIITF